MNIVKVKFNRPQNIKNMATYRPGEIAGFTKQLAGQIVKAGAGVIVDDRPKAAEEKKAAPAK